MICLANIRIFKQGLFNDLRWTTQSHRFMETYNVQCNFDHNSVDRLQATCFIIIWCISIDLFLLGAADEQSADWSFPGDGNTASGSQYSRGSVTCCHGDCAAVCWRHKWNIPFWCGMWIYFLAQVTIVTMGYSHRFLYGCVCVCVCVVRWLTFPIKRIFSYSFLWIALKFWWNVLYDHVIMGCAFLSDSLIFEFLANFWKFWDRNLYICYTLHYTFERTVRHSVFVAQWLARRTGVREVPSSIPLDVTYIVSSFYFL